LYYLWFWYQTNTGYIIWVKMCFFLLFWKNFFRYFSCCCVLNPW
jgi:hypothetical protein